MTDPSTEPERKLLASTVIAQITRLDFQKAFELARDLSFDIHDDEDIGLEATVIDILAFQNLEEALHLLPLVREGATKFEAYSYVGNALARNDRLDDAISNGKEFTGEQQIRYYIRIGSNVNVMEDSESIFAMLDKLPTEIARSRIATTQISNNQRSDVYDEDQIERLNKYLTNEDRALLKKIDEEGLSVPDSYLGY